MGGANGWIAGWKFGTPYISLVSTETAASDEPAAFTAGGNLIYYGEGSFNHEGFGTIDIQNPQVGDWKWSGSVNAISKYTELSLRGKFGSSSGAYSYMDGFNHFSPIPYNGKLYVINGNTLYALSPNGTASSSLPTAQTPTTQKAASIPTSVAQFQQRLYDEIQKMLSAGHLRPGFHSSGLTSQNMDGDYTYPIPGEQLTQYFKNPSETVITLIGVIDYINAHPENTSLQSLTTPIKNYIQNNYSPGKTYDFTKYASVGWRNGAKREAYDDLPEFTAQLADDYDVNYSVANKPRECIWAYNNLIISSPGTASCWMNDQAKSGFPPENLYAAWQYAKAFNFTSTQALTLFNSMKSKLSVADQNGVNNDMTDTNLTKFPYLLNQYIIGYRGYIELDKMANNLSDISQSSKYTEYTRLLNLRWSGYSKDPNWSIEEGEFNGTLNAARNFMYMTPELGDLMRSNILVKVQQTVDQYQILTPNWFVSKYAHSGPESYSQPLYDYPSLFQARAYVLKQPFEELVKYMDVPAFERGDLYYIQNLIALLTAADQQGITPSPTIPTTPTPTPVLGDVTGDGHIRLDDLVILLSNFGKSGMSRDKGDLNNDQSVNLSDLVILLSNFGK